MNQESALPVAVDKLDLILDKLNAIESRLNKLESLTQNIPGVVATVSDTLDDYFQHQNPDSERIVPELNKVLHALMQPEVLSGLNQALDLLPALVPHLASLETLPGLLATAGDTFDESMAYLEAHGISVLELLPDLSSLMTAVLKPERLQALLHFVDALPELTPMVLLAKDLPGMVATATDTIDELSVRLLSSEARIEKVVSHVSQMLTIVKQGQKEAPALGPVGVLKTLGDADIQRFLGFLVYVSKHISQDILKK